MSIPLQTGIVYGPLSSRRFGQSLGINFLPNDQKICSLDCVYCQYGKTSRGKSFDLPTPREFKDAVESALSKINKEGVQVDSVTIAGNGEPTLHPHFLELVQKLLALRDQYIPNTDVGILTNSSTCHRTKIQEALALLDFRFMKLDAGSHEVFNQINQPLSKVLWEKMILGLCQLQNIGLQSLFVTGRVDNTGDQDVGEWIEVVERISPESVQIYTLDRSPGTPDILPVSKGKLESISQRLAQKTAIPSLVF